MMTASHVLDIQSSRGTSDVTSPIFFASWQLSFGRYNAPKFERFRLPVFECQSVRESLNLQNLDFASRTYRSRQYYESKILHNAEVTCFPTFHRFPKLFILIKKKLLKNVLAPFITLLLAPFKFKAQIGRFYSPQSMLFLENFDFLVNFEAKWSKLSISQEILRTNFERATLLPHSLTVRL